MTANVGLFLPDIFKKKPFDKSALQEKKTPKRAEQLRLPNPFSSKTESASNVIAKLKLSARVKKIKAATNQETDPSSYMQSSQETHDNNSDMENSPETHRNNAAAVSSLMASLIIKKDEGNQK